MSGARAVWTDAEVLAILWAHRARGQTCAQLALVHGVTRNAILGVVHRVETALTEAEIAALPDDLWLGVLDRFEGSGIGAEAVAKEFAPQLPAGRLTRNAVLLLVHLARIECARVPDAATRPENRDGGMKRRWWASGIWRRGMAA